MPKKIKKNVTDMKKPYKYSMKIQQAICSRLAEGESLRTVCQDVKMPTTMTVFRWIRENEDFKEAYILAKEESADAMAEDILVIADDGTNDYMEDNYDKGKTPGFHFNGENVQRSRLRLEARKWLMARYKPKKFGDHLDLSHSGVIKHKYQGMTDEQLNRIIEERKNRTLGTS